MATAAARHQCPEALTPSRAPPNIAKYAEL